MAITLESSCYVIQCARAFQSIILKSVRLPIEGLHLLVEEFRMAVVIAYQSLNSNVSTTHNIQASKSQQFTIKTHDHSAQSSEPWMLQLPTADGVAPNVPIHGPAQLLPTAPEGTMDKGKQTDASFLSMVEGKALQIHQNSIRSFPRPCDLLVLGELDATHTDWASMKSKARIWQARIQPKRRKFEQQSITDENQYER